MEVSGIQSFLEGHVRLIMMLGWYSDIGPGQCLART